MMEEYEGKERRKNQMNMNQEDRDLLIRMDTNLTNLTLLMNNHIMDDRSVFKKQNDDIDWLKKITYMGMGMLIILNIALKLIK